MGSLRLHHVWYANEMSRSQAPSYLCGIRYINICNVSGFSQHTYVHLWRVRIYSPGSDSALHFRSDVRQI